MRKPAFCICENKDANQLRGYSEADQRLCFLYIDSTTTLLSKYEISTLYLSSVVVQPCLCGTWTETRRPVFSQRGSFCLCSLESPCRIYSNDYQPVTKGLWTSFKKYLQLLLN